MTRSKQEDNTPHLFHELLDAPTLKERRRIVKTIVSEELLEQLQATMEQHAIDAEKGQDWKGARKYGGISKLLVARLQEFHPDTPAASEPTPATVKRTEPASYEEWSRAKDEYEPDLSEAIHYTGQFRAARHMLVQLGEYTPEAIAMMTDEEVLRCIQVGWKVVVSESEHILLVRRDNLEEFSKLCWWLNR